MPLLMQTVSLCAACRPSRACPSPVPTALTAAASVMPIVDSAPSASLLMGLKEREVARHAWRAPLARPHLQSVLLLATVSA
jgi:hypothetical protein